MTAIKCFWKRYKQLCKSYGYNYKNVLITSVLLLVFIYLLFCMVDYSSSQNIFGMNTEAGHSWNILFYFLG